MNAQVFRAASAALCLSLATALACDAPTAGPRLSAETDDGPGRTGLAVRGKAGPILVELFTSQGCSSCPPADRVLSLLHESGQVDGVPIVVLSEHVDYWNRLGWADPYSRPQFSERQAMYSRSISNSSRVYTPQMVVDGRVEFVGHNLRRATEAIREAAGHTHLPLRLEVATVGKLRLRCAVHIPDMQAADAELHVAITEDELSDQVTRGENAGNRLRHDGVVRRLERRSAGPGRSHVEFELEEGWQRDKLRIVAWLADEKTGAVLGTAAQPVE